MPVLAKCPHRAKRHFSHISISIPVLAKCPHRAKRHFSLISYFYAYPPKSPASHKAPFFASLLQMFPKPAQSSRHRVKSNYIFFTHKAPLLAPLPK